MFLKYIYHKIKSYNQIKLSLKLRLFFVLIFIFSTIFIIGNVYALTFVSTSNKNLVKNGLIGYWTFDGKDTTWTSSTTATTRDLTGSGNTGTLTWMKRSISPVGGKIGQALKFDGDVTLVNIGSPVTLDNLNNFSYSAWVNVSGSPENSRGRIFAKNITGGDNTGVSLDYYDGIFMGDVFSASVGFDTTDSLATSQSVYNITGAGNNYKGGWQHLVMTYNGTTKSVSLYLNGVEVNYQTHTSGVGTRDDDSAENFYIGNSVYGTRSFNGKIDDARVYNRALSAREVQSLYKAGGGVTKSSVSNTKTNTNGVGLSNGLISHWTFDGKNTTWTSSATGTTRDVSGNNNTGTFANMSKFTSPIGGKIGQAFRFDGSANVQTASYNILGTTASTSFTVSGWFNYSSTTLAGMYIIEYGGGGAFVVENVAASSSMRCKVRDPGAGFLNSNSVVRPQIGQWHFFSCVYNASNKTLAFNIDDSNRTPVSIASFSTFDNPGQLFLGARSYGNSGFTGSLDDIRVYNRALSTKELLSLYKLGQTSMAVTQTTKSNISNNLVSQWSFDGKDMNWLSSTAEVRNKVDPTNHADYINPSMSYVRPGKLGQALFFDGTTTRIQSAKSPLLDTEPSGFSQTLWVKRTATGTNSYLTEMGGSDAFDILYDISPHRIGCRIRDSASHMPEVYQSGWTPKLNQWYFIACVYDPNSDTLKIYINDSVNSVDASTFNGTFINVNGINIGARGYGSNYHTGLIDDIRFYNRALSAKEIQSLYRLGSQ